jgi:hypothetical protein
MRMRKLDRKIGGHSKQTYDRKQVREKAHGGTLLVSGMASLMGGSDKRCDIGHKMSLRFALNQHLGKQTLRWQG